MGPLCLGVEIGGTKLQAGLGRGDGRIVALERRRIEPSRGAEGIRRQVVEVVDRLLETTGLAPGAIGAVGIGFGGPVDVASGTTIRSHQVEGWDEFPLADWARSTLGVARAIVQNDADTAALAEARHGAGVGFDPLLYVTIGSGIGGGLVVDGSIYRGSGRGAVEIGHLLVGEPTEGGARSTLEGLASGWAIASEAIRRLAVEGGATEGALLLRLAGGDPARVTTGHVAKAARSGDLLALGVLADARDAFGRGLAHAITLLAPRRVVLGGGVSLIDESLWLAPIRERVERYAFPPYRGTYEIVTARLGEGVVVHGGIELAVDALTGKHPPRGLTLPT